MLSGGFFAELGASAASFLFPSLAFSVRHFLSGRIENFYIQGGKLGSSLPLHCLRQSPS